MRHSIKVQAVVFIERNFLDVVIRRVGSTHHASMLLESHIWHNNIRYLNEGDVLFGEVAYPQTPFLLTPFRQHESIGNQENARFNEQFSEVRIGVELSFGVLK